MSHTPTTPTPPSAGLADPADPVSSPPPGTPSLTGRTAKGFAWLMIQTIFERIVSAGGQVALAWLLAPGDYKLIALVYTVTSFASLIQQAGLSQVLVQRHRRFDRWATPVFWMAITFGLIAGGLTALFSGSVASFYGEPKLRGLLLVASLTLPLGSLNVVPDALLRGSMRFKPLAVTGLTATTASMALSIVLASLGFGAYSFIIPAPVAMLGRALLLWSIAKPRIRFHPHFKRWRMLIGDSGLMLGASMALMCTYVGDWIILGRMYRDLPEVGIYFFALSLADQANRALVVNLSGVLFPALRTLQADASRQALAFLRAARVLSLAGMPICLLQAVLAAPLFRTVFPDDKASSIPVFAVISIAMIGRQLFGPSESMLLAQRRQRIYLIIALTYAPIFLALATLGAARSGAVGVACAVTATALLLGPITLRIAIAPADGTWKDVFAAVRAPLLACLLTIGPAWALTYFLPRSLVFDLVAITIVPAAALAGYAAIIRTLAPQDWRELAQKFSALARRIARRPRAS